MQYNEKSGRMETHTREICRSVARGAKRAVENFDLDTYLHTCVRGVATVSVYGMYAGGAAGALVGALSECGGNMIAQAFVDGGVRQDIVSWVNGTSTASSAASKFAKGTTQIVEFRGPFYP